MKCLNSIGVVCHNSRKSLSFCQFGRGGGYNKLIFSALYRCYSFLEFLFSRLFSSFTTRCHSVSYCHSERSEESIGGFSGFCHSEPQRIICSAPCGSCNTQEVHFVCFGLQLRRQHQLPSLTSRQADVCGWDYAALASVASSLCFSLLHCPSVAYCHSVVHCHSERSEESIGVYRFIVTSFHRIILTTYVVKAYRSLLQFLRTYYRFCCNASHCSSSFFLTRLFYIISHELQCFQEVLVPLYPIGALASFLSLITIKK